MKTEHQHDHLHHELRENELGKLALRAGSYFEQFGNQILLGLAAVFLVLAAVIWLIRTSQSDKAVGWTAFVSARTAEQYANVADDYAGAAVGTWARLNEAESHLQNGMQQAFTDREAAKSDLAASEESFQKVLDATPLPRPARARALLGLARAREALSDGDNGPALEAYRQFIEEFPESVDAAHVKLRIESLESGQAQEFYAWFHSQNPKPEDRELPRDANMGLPEGHPRIDPGFGRDTLEFDRWTTPFTIPDLMSVEGVEVDGEAEKPADGAAPESDSEAESKPESSSEKPASEKPAESPTPSDSK